MEGIARHLWLVPTLPLVAAGVLALVPRRERRWAAGLAIGALAVSLALALLAFARTLTGPGVRLTHNFTWLEFGDARLVLGWVLDPLGAAMLVMVTVVGLLIFVFSLGYMAADENFTRFFCFLSLFAGAMLGVVIANSLLLLFICWELVGLASYLLIGFWYDKPAAAAAAKKAFITTRIGDMALLVGMLWLYTAGGTLVFYDGGEGCLEAGAVNRLAAQTLTGGLTLSTALGLLIFVGAMGKSGQVPLHVWLPDAMEGPTPVSALIHAATMVAAGVFLVARMFPLLAALPAGAAGGVSVALQAVTWVGALTAVFAAVIAVAQTDIKRILAYSTVSQLGYMFVGLGVGGVAVGMFHLLTHAFFKALLFLGAGSVIHGCHHEQDIRRMGGLRRLMPVTFATYAVGMMALAGVPVFFAGFWSKDAILHAAHGWPVSQGPYYLVVLGALLTAFYMTRQVCYVFFGQPRNAGHAQEPAAATVHESPRVMTFPLIALAVFAVGLGFLGTPAWPWLQRYLEGLPAVGDWGRMFAGGAGAAMLLSAVIVALGIGLGWWLYGRRVIPRADSPDVLEVSWPQTYALLRQKFLVDELYEATVERAHAGWAALSERLDRWVWGGFVWLVELIAQGLAWASRLVDEYVVNLGFDAACRRLNRDGRTAAGLTDGQLPNYLRALGTAFVCLVLMLMWGRLPVNEGSWLTLLTFTPLIGGVAVIALGPRRAAMAQRLALGVALTVLALAVLVGLRFDVGSGSLQFVERHAWIPALGVHYHLGVDGLGLLMIVLTGLLVPMAMLASWRLGERGSLYFGLMLWLEAGLLGTFTALNFFHWFLFWELSLVPAFFLIKLWGGRESSAAAAQFFVYTMVGSVAMLLGFLAVYLAVGTFDFVELAGLGARDGLTAAFAQQLAGTGLPAGVLTTAVFLAVFLGLAVKVPLMPFHTWLPATYAEAPTGVTMLLTGAMSKMGVYGFLRLLLPIFPESLRAWQGPLLGLAVLTILFSAAAAFAQRDLKRLLAYSSINHLGYCLLGVFAVATTASGTGRLAQESAAALNGVLLQMFNHGLTAATLFCFVGWIEQRAGGLRGLDDFGGLRRVAPVLTGLMGIALFSSLGLPGLNGFVGEFLIFKGSFALAPWATVGATGGLLLTAVFLLTLSQRVFHGPLNPRWQTLPDLSRAERWIVAPATALMFLVGLYPQSVLGFTNETVKRWVALLP